MRIKKLFLVLAVSALILGGFSGIAEAKKHKKHKTKEVCMVVCKTKAGKIDCKVKCKKIKIKK